MENSQKYIIGISGHRDPKKKQIHRLLNKITEILNAKVVENPKKEVVILTPLADGADRLVARCAAKLGLKYEVILPMARELYEMDFGLESLEEFNEYCANASNISTLPLCDEIKSHDEIKEYNPKRDLQYQAVGKYIVDNSDFMIFMWDGEKNDLVGGTYDIYSYKRKKDKKFATIKTERE
jgi:uncharacterized phage-like protein YoqJ